MQGRTSIVRTTVLLFYDGRERRAEEAMSRRIRADLRRHARVLVKRLRRKQVKSGYYTWLCMLIEALERAACDVRLNDFKAARANPDHPIGVVGYRTIFDKIDTLANPRLIGPGIYPSPLENPSLFDDARNRLYISTCQWHSDMFRPFYGDRLRRWFGGFDVNRFETAEDHAKEFDVMIYDKIIFQRDENYRKTIQPFVTFLDSSNHSYTMIRYGDYIDEDYIEQLKACRSMAFFCHSETQGMAYQQCLAMNIPIFAWDEGIWPHPDSFKINPSGVPCTSVPYFSDRCGMRFKAEDMLEKWPRFWAGLPNYRPRDFVAETLTFERSAELYLSAYRELCPSVERLTCGSG